MAETLTQNHEILEGPQAPKQSRFVQQFRLFKENRLAAVGLVIFLAFFITAVAGVVLTSGQDPVFDPSLVRLQEKLLSPLSRPNLETLKSHEVPTLGMYLLGTDDLGRDVFARMLQGAWVSLTVGFVAVGIAVIVGIFMGGLAGYYGQGGIGYDQILSISLLLTGITALFLGWVKWGGALFGVGVLGFVFSLAARRRKQSRLVPEWLQKTAFSFDTLIMRMVDIMLCFPSFFLILTVVALLPASIYNIMIVIGLTSWMGTTRFVRAEFLSLREQDFVSAAKALGVSNFRIIFRHMMPNAIAPVLVSATIGIATAILTEAGLSFLGFGVPPPYATWGNILSDGKRFIFDAPWLTFVPGVAILIVVLCFNLFGEGLKDALNPKLRQE
jgi:peptide/nickel transport system permease protein